MRRSINTLVPRLLLMSASKTDYYFGEEVAAFVPAVNRKNSGAWLIQLRRFKRAVQLQWDCINCSKELPLIAYMYTRALHFTSLSLSRTIPFPITLARNYLKWKIGSRYEVKEYLWMNI